MIRHVVVGRLKPEAGPTAIHPALEAGPALRTPAAELARAQLTPDAPTA